MGQPCSHWTDFHEIWHLRVFRKYVGKIKFPLVSHMATLHENLRKFMTMSRSIPFLNVKCFGQYSFAEQNHTLYIQWRLSENRAIYEISWKICYSQSGHRWHYNAALAFCILDKKDYRHSCRICHNCCFSTEIIFRRMRLYVTLCVYCLSCLITQGLPNFCVHIE
jgi:hypothetical protein